MEVPKVCETECHSVNSSRRKWNKKFNFIDSFNIFLFGEARRYQISTEFYNYMGTTK